MKPNVSKAWPVMTKRQWDAETKIVDREQIMSPSYYRRETRGHVAAWIAASKPATARTSGRSLAGLTHASQSSGFTDSRADADRAAGALLGMVEF
jgi:hypothetical protein